MKLVWTRLAIQDLNQAHEFIETVNPRAAAGTIDRIERAVTALTVHPNSGRPGRIEGVRELVVIGTPFIVPYRVRGNRVEVLGIIHGARQWPDSL